jgi:hypothetical protein
VSSAHFYFPSALENHNFSVTRGRSAGKVTGVTVSLACRTVLSSVESGTYRNIVKKGESKINFHKPCDVALLGITKQRVAREAAAAASRRPEQALQKANGIYAGRVKFLQEPHRHQRDSMFNAHVFRSPYSTEHFLRSGLTAEDAKFRRLCAISEEIQPDFSTRQTVWRTGRDSITASICKLR